MPASSPNPYRPPADGRDDGAASPKREGLGVALSGFLVLQIAFNSALAGWFLFAMPAAQTADPLAPAWSFPVRAAFSVLLAAACVALLLRKRAALYVYFLLCIASLPLNVARGLRSVPTLLLSVAGPAAIVGFLVRKKTSQLS